jgi:hypothetical protein
MTEQASPRGRQVLLGRMAHLARFIDKIRLGNAGRIQDYNYITVWDQHLIDLLGIDFESDSECCTERAIKTSLPGSKSGSLANVERTTIHV